MTDDTLQIRPYDAEDLEALQRIRAAAFAPIFEGFRAALGAPLSAVALATAEAEQAAHLADICADEAPQRVLVAERNGEIIGFVGFSLDAASKLGEIGLNAVHPDHAGQGVGPRLYNVALDHMRAAGMKAASVGTGGDDAHAPARRAYAKAGFGPAIPSLWMYRLL